MRSPQVGQTRTGGERFVNGEGEFHFCKNRFKRILQIMTLARQEWPRSVRKKNYLEKMR
jgi:hypothetical protein